MKIPPGTSERVTHNLIIADRSEAGMFAIATMLDLCPEADGCINVWRSSTDRFILFVLDYNESRAGSITATDLEHLLVRVLPELYFNPFKPPANVAFDIFVDEVDAASIDDRIAQLQISIALEAGLSHQT